MFQRLMAFVCAAPLVAVLFHGTAAADPADEAQSCVGFEKTDEDHAISYQAKNSCDEKLSCRVSWVVTCSDIEGKTTARSKKASSFSLAESGEHSFTLSADGCKQSWSIDEVSWACKGAR